MQLIDVFVVNSVAHACTMLTPYKYLFSSLFLFLFDFFLYRLSRHCRWTTRGFFLLLFLPLGLCIYLFVSHSLFYVYSFLASLCLFPSFCLHAVCVCCLLFLHFRLPILPSMPSILVALVGIDFNVYLCLLVYLSFFVSVSVFLRLKIFFYVVWFSPLNPKS